MLSPEEIGAVTHHGAIHKIGLCACPCFDALVKVSKAIEQERELMAKLGAASPEALAVLVGSGKWVEEEDPDGN